MNLQTHLINIQKEFLNSLSKKKREMVTSVLKNAKTLGTLLNTDSFDFKINQVRRIYWTEIPITRYAHEEQIKQWENIAPKEKDFVRATELTLERLFTYWEEDDLCDMQGQFYYFIDENNNELFCESEFGNIKDFGKRVGFERIKIATIKDLKGKNILNAEKLNWLLE
ncbi:hypothetical protein [Pseudochryseolinea flava]|uniref:Uncharacterized protein n=1 Tax=Pseudochryseolinea flava TaxID=2059302 RepID=A0A364XUF0_9BACT|nr:hypothetical protein [Pseudochryseolinea flava]RAV97795.1 hypothetical protein DQQ10_26855 [Pseudochryseolinea flava]